MNGYCINDKYCRYKSDAGYCSYTGDCVMDNVRTVTIPIEQPCIKREFDLTKESIDAIAEAVVKRLRGEEE